MASQQPGYRSADVAGQVLNTRIIDLSTPLPLRCRTFRVSEVPPDINAGVLRTCLDSLQIDEGLIEGNSVVFSLAPYRSWQVATVSFHREPDVFARCKPGHEISLQLTKRQVSTALYQPEHNKRTRFQPDDERHTRMEDVQIQKRAVPILVTVDCDFYSMTPLYAPIGTTAKYDIIAVTGLSAHAFGSWKSPDRADRMWLRDYLRLEFSDIRVFTWGYYSSIRNEKSTTFITALSRNFLEDVKQVREHETVSRPLILIGHSLGGLVLQKALVDASKGNSTNDKSFHRSCIGLIFFGVPHQGLNPKSIEMLAEGNENKHFLRDISTSSQYLVELESDFKICHKGMKRSTIVSFYESEDTLSVETFANGEAKRCGAPIRMVPRESAVCSVSEDCNRIEIRADHSLMVKFRSESDKHYQRVITKIKEIRETYEKDGVREKLPGNEIRQIMTFISPLESYKRHQDIRQKRLEGTGDWFLREPAFEKWRDCESDDGNKGSVLACSGIPGAGKSVICSLVIEHLETKFSSEEKACVACLYCDYLDDEKQTPVNMIGVLLKQVIARLNESGYLPLGTITDLGKRINENRIFDLALTCRLLGDCVKQLRRLYVCIDALDECNEQHRREFIQALANVSSECSQATMIRIFFTTRPHIKWEELMNRYLGLGTSGHICLKAHPDDIRISISHEIDIDENSDCMNEQLRNEILDTIIDNSDGMFLLPALQIKTVLDETTIRKRRDALSNMATKLEGAFEITITRIKNQKVQRSQQAMEVLKWTFLAQRPLTVAELRHALSVTIDPSKIQAVKLPLAYDQTVDWDNLPSEKSLLDWCLGLIVFDDETSTVRLVHKSLHDHLTQLYDAGEIFTNGHSEIAYTCLQYMRFKDDQHDINPSALEVSPQIKEERQARFCLLDYTTKNFGHHLKYYSGCKDDMIHKLFPDKVDLNCISTGFRATFLSPFDYPSRRQNSAKDQYTSTTQIHLRLQFAISYGFQDTFFRLLDISEQTIDYDFWLSGSTMLLQASRVGNEEIVRVLLSRGADVNISDYNHYTPLHWASQNGYDALVKVLLNADGIEINSRKMDGQTALILASVNGRNSVVELLLQAERIEVNSMDRSGGTALSLASLKGHDSVVDLLLQVDCIDVNSTDDRGWSALALASVYGHDSTLKLLLKAEGIDVNSQFGSGWTVLSWASAHCCRSAVKLLLQVQGINVNCTYGFHPAVIIEASMDGDDEIVGLLLQVDDIDINMKDMNGMTALSWACSEGHDSVVNLLLQASGIDVNSKDHHNRAALSFASSNGHDLVVNLLLQASGIDVNSKDHHNRAALSFASSNGHDLVVKMLLQAGGIEINSQDNNGQTALILASGNGHNSVVELLVQADCINVNSKDDYGWSALALASVYGHEKVLELLLQADGIDVTSPFDSGWTALSWASAHCYRSVVGLLLQAEGTEFNSKDDFGWTALSLASANGHHDIVKMLLETNGININSKNDHGDTALLLASANGYHLVVELLLKANSIYVNSKNVDGDTAFSMASQNGQHLVVKLLLGTGGININSKDDYGNTALSLASVNGYHSVVKLLLQENGILVNTKNINGNTALSLASQNGHCSVLKLLLQAGGIDVNSKDTLGLTALSWAFDKAYDSIVQLLQAAGGIDGRYSQ